MLCCRHTMGRRGRKRKAPTDPATSDLLTSESPTSDPTEETSTSTGPAMSYERAHRRKPRAYVSFDARGVDLSKLSEAEKDKLRSALGVEHVNGVPAPPVATPTDPALVAMLLQALASLEAMILARKFKLPVEACSEACKLREPVASSLAECCARILDKYNVMGRYQDEVAAVSLVVVWQSGIFAQVRELEKEHNEARNRMGPAQARQEHASAGSGSVAS